MRDDGDNDTIDVTDGGKQQFGMELIIMEWHFLFRLEYF